MSADKAGETQLRRADAVVVAEGTAFLAQDHRSQVAHACVVSAHASTSRYALK